MGIAGHSFWVIAALAVTSAWAEMAQVYNPAGDISIRSAVGSQEPAVHVSVIGRPPRADDARITRRPGLLLVECRPSDGAKVNLDIILPPATELEASTGSGAITTRGLIRRAELTTDSGSMSLSAPWNMMRLRVVCRRRPKYLVKESLNGVPLRSHNGSNFWVLSDDLFPIDERTQIPSGQGLSALAHTIFQGIFPRTGTYGEIRVEGDSPSKLEIKNEALPPDTWIRPTSDASKVRSVLLRPGSRPPPDNRPLARSWPGSAFAAPRGTPKFVSNVHMVSLATPLKDSSGEPIVGLGPQDFEVLEDGVPQQIASAGSQDLPFNLVLLLDMSSSTLNMRAEMIEAARGFVRMAGPRDRVAIYALADTLFQVISPLTEDRRRVEELIPGLPPVGGNTPLYDAMLLSYSQEGLAGLPDRTALIVISDGEDLSLYSRLNPAHGHVLSPSYPGGFFLGWSVVPFKRLLAMVSGMPVLIYPIMLSAEQHNERDRRLAALGEENLKELAQATGGCLFHADSLHALDSVYLRVQTELRSIYQISYYPKNRSLDGRWRNVIVRVAGSGAVLRTRAGYFSR